jgi:hypothetical protein
MQLSEALSQIGEIRSQVERAGVYRGYRAAPVAASGLIAWGAGAAQWWLISDPLDNIGVYLCIWVCAAVLSLVASGGEILFRYRRTESETGRARTRQAVGQFAPCLLAGGLLTVVVLLAAADATWLLPGLWSVFFSLGIFASLRVLPRGMVRVGFFYLLWGLAAVVWAQGPYALSPWVMAVPFGCGQLLAAAILYWELERPVSEIN